MAQAICLYLELHQPWRLTEQKTQNLFDLSDETASTNLFSAANKTIFQKVAAKSYYPTFALIKKLLASQPGFNLALSCSGVWLEQAQAFEPVLIKRLQALVSSGRVEILGETFFHSLSFLFSKAEFIDQIIAHRNLIIKLFGRRPTVFRNTELIYRDDIAPIIKALGFRGMLAEGADHILDWRQPTYVYQAHNTDNFNLLLKHYKLSDDIAFRFSNRAWADYPLSPKRFVQWVEDTPGDVVNLFMDFETFGEHQWEDSGIFTFMEALPAVALAQGIRFVSPTQALQQFLPVATLSFPMYVSWADDARDLTAWIGNQLQDDVLNQLKYLEPEVKKLNVPAKLLKIWQRLTTSDHFYYCCTKWSADGDVHAYFSPFESPYDAYITFRLAMEALGQALKKHHQDHHLAESKETLVSDGGILEVQS